jgi:SAM-dependent methyltransferase
MRSMELQYRLMYRLGITPWDHELVPEPLRRLVEGSPAVPIGTAVDLGCGTGKNAAYLAGLGWEVTAVDVSPVAIAQARARSGTVKWGVADLTVRRPPRIFAELAGTVSLILDVGCLHGLTDDGRRRWGEIAQLLATPGAHVLVRAAPAVRLAALGPAGLRPGELGSLLGPGWSVRPTIDPHWQLFERPAPRR